MRKTIEFKPSVNQSTTALLQRTSPAYEDLILAEKIRKYRHRFESGKTKIRLLPALPGGNNWLLQIPTLQHPQGRHAHPRTIQRGAKGAFDAAYEYLKQRNPSCLFSRSNRSGFRLLPSAMSICWAVVHDKNGIKLRLLLHNFYDSSRGGTMGLGHMIYNQVQLAGNDCNQPGHPLNHMDGTSLEVERKNGSDSKIPSYHVGIADERSPLQPLLDKLTDVEFNALVPLEQAVHIAELDEEWRLLAKAIGNELADEIRSAQEIDAEDDDPDAEPDYSDFPKKWEI